LFCLKEFGLRIISSASVLYRIQPFILSEKPFNTLETFLHQIVSDNTNVFSFAADFQILYMDEKQIEILGKTAQLFMRFGIKSMTMDDVARQLGISKKTLYQYVSDKNDLVVKVMQNLVEREKRVSNKLCAIHDNAIDMLFELSKDISQKFGQIHPSINYDLEKYHPEAWNIYEAFRTKFVADCIEQNIINGIKQGLFRDNLDPYVISRLYANKMELCTDGEVFPADKYNFKDIHLELMRYHIRGIASEQGLVYLKQKIKNDNYQL
jgi:TetR/AcrR family transcriptional regulator, cholesterol catabolism regulator